MNRQNAVILKKGKEKAIWQRHHWIFSGAIHSLPSFTDGDIQPVCSFEGDPLGYGYFNRKAKIIGRMVSFEQGDPHEIITARLHQAIQLRSKLFKGANTTAYRLVNGEGDFLPGLVIDRYGDHLVLQSATLGMDKLKPLIVKGLCDQLTVKSLYEKSVLPTRKEEGLPDAEGHLLGVMEEKLEVLENGQKFIVNPIEGQKTGLFLDHREMRLWIKQLAAGKRVLNCFAYTGGFSVFAAAGQALQVDSVDISGRAIRLAEQNMQMNGFSGRFFEADVFRFLRECEFPYDLVILDPPAFAKRQKDVIPACRGYKDINRIAMQRMPPESILLTCSCSYHVDEQLFQKVVFQAAVEAGRRVRIIGRHRLAQDHPVNICHPEGDYLKSLLLFIE